MMCKKYTSTMIKKYFAGVREQYRRLEREALAAKEAKKEQVEELPEKVPPIVTVDNG